jgi:hypothetical protein
MISQQTDKVETAERHILQAQQTRDSLLSCSYYDQIEDMESETTMPIRE